jgi:hypothetical protein
MKKRILTALVVLMGMFLLSASIVWAQPAPIAKTGQTTYYHYGDDGHRQKGVASPSPRFTDIGDGTVRDRLTGLMWAKDAQLGGSKTWENALIFANVLYLGTSCGTARTDWRLPNVKELQSLVDFSKQWPPLPLGHPFTNVQFSNYWSSNSTASGTYARIADMKLGSSYPNANKTNYYYVWPVRGGN